MRMQALYGFDEGAGKKGKLERVGMCGICSSLDCLLGFTLPYVEGLLPGFVATILGTLNIFDVSCSGAFDIPQQRAKKRFRMVAVAVMRDQVRSCRYRSSSGDQHLGARYVRSEPVPCGLSSLSLDIDRP